MSLGCGDGRLRPSDGAKLRSLPRARAPAPRIWFRGIPVSWIAESMVNSVQKLTLRRPQIHSPIPLLTAARLKAAPFQGAWTNTAKPQFQDTRSHLINGFG